MISYIERFDQINSEITGQYVNQEMYWKIHGDQAAWTEERGM